MTSHVALTLMFEQSLQSVNPSITVPYWDFTVEGTTLNSTTFRSSGVFADDWFGTATPKNVSSEWSLSKAHFFSGACAGMLFTKEPPAELNEPKRVIIVRHGHCLYSSCSPAADNTQTQQPCPFHGSDQGTFMLGALELSNVTLGQCTYHSLPVDFSPFALARRAWRDMQVWPCRGMHL